MKKKPPLERTIVRQIQYYLSSLENCYWVKTHGDKYTRHGVPDLLVCYNGQFIALEVKRPQLGKLTDNQKQELAKISAAGGLAAVVTSVEDVKRLLTSNTFTSCIVTMLQR